MLICLILLAVLSSASCSLQSETPTLERRINEIINLPDGAQAPGYAIGAVKDGRLFFAKGYGVADLATGAAITHDTPFNLASLSKQFTAAAIALEIQNHTITLDDLLSEHWPNLPAFMNKITVGHLIYMTSGLPEYYTLPSPKGGWDSEDAFTVHDAISAAMASGKLEYEPGSRWTYSNINYQFLAELTEKLSEKSFSTHLESEIFEPLNMSNTWVDDDLQSHTRSAATAYVEDEASGEWREAPRLSPHYGGSGVFASLHDLAKWDAALFETHALGENFTEIMLSTKTYEHEKSNDAFGLVHGEYKGQPTLWYEGGDYGVSTYIIRFTNQKTTFICLANFARAECRSILINIADLVLGEQ